MIKEKQVGEYKLVFEKKDVKISNDMAGNVGRVYITFWQHNPEPVVESLNGCFVRVAVAQAAAEFLTECLDEQERERLSKFKCETEYTFERSAADPAYVEVKCNGSVITILNKNANYRAVVPEAVVAAARKFAGWDR